MAANLFQQTTLLSINTNAAINASTKNDVEIQLRESRSGSLNDYNGKIITIKGGRTRKVRSNEFKSRTRESGRCSILKVFINGVDSGRCLVPSDFEDYVKIVFTVVESDHGSGKFRLATIDGVSALLLDQFSRLGFLGYFGHDDYRGRSLTRMYN